MRRHRATAATVLVLAVLAGCGDDDGDEGAGDIERYCELTEELDRAGDEAFDGLGEDATEEDFAAAAEQLVEDNEDRIDDLQDAAPPEIREQLNVLVEALRSGQFFTAEEPPAEVAEAEEAVQAFEDENCPSLEE